MKIFVTGMGVISSIGDNLQENLSSLKNGKSGISPIEGLQSMRKPFVGGQIKRDDTDLREWLNVPNHLYVHRSTLLGLCAAKEAWADRTHFQDLKTGIIFGTTIGGVDLSGELITELAHAHVTHRIDFRRTHDEGFGTDFIARNLGIKDYKASLSTACSTAANSILLGARLIRAKVLDRVLVGGAEAITNYTLNGFDALMLYDFEKCKPFDRNRKGLNLGEAGAFLVLENEQSMIRTGAERMAELIGWSNTCDSYHITASSPEGKGATIAITEALAMAGISPDQVDYINAHGTGTLNNDLSESMALQNVFGDNIPAFSSTKSFTGHTLAAAGGIEAIYSVLSVKHNLIFPNLNFSQAMDEVPFRPALNTVEKPGINIAISNSFGFGGNCTELVFKA